MLPIYDQNPTRRTPVVTVGLIISCALVFLWEQSLPETRQDAVIASLSVIPSHLLHYVGSAPNNLLAMPPVVTVFTAMFMHADAGHLLGNMLYLWIFGNNVEDVLGHGRFLLFYLACGIVAALSQVLSMPESTVPMLGSSGAVAGILGAYMLRYPNAWVLIWAGFLTFWLPAVVVLGFWFALQVLNSLSVQEGGGGIAWYAHIGGFVAGMVILLALGEHKPQKSDTENQG